MKGLHNYIIFEDEEIVAFNKPAGLLTIPDRTQSERSLKDILIDRFGSIFTVHRIDKETSGLVIFAKNEAAHKYYSSLFEERKIDKYYLGIVIGQPNSDSGTVDAPIAEHHIQKGLMVVHRSGKPSVTDYEVLEGNRFYSLVQFRLHTGRTHQIRVHMKQIGHPLACDPLYGDGKPVLLSSFKKKFKLSKATEEEHPMISRLALHSYKLLFKDRSGKQMELTAEIPKEFRALMNQLKKLTS
jgi:23S rRNA pseudouridine955/2504/2580 synthase/23S rRNA pseudouridine1911/1915/1917 synthase